MCFRGEVEFHASPAGRVSVEALLSGVQPTGPVLYKMGWGSDGGESNAVTGIRPHKPLPKPEHL